MEAGSFSVKRIASDRETVGMLFPDWLADVLSDEKAYVYAADDNKNSLTAGAGIFTLSGREKNLAIIHYCSVLGAYRNMGLGSMIVESMIKALKKNGIEYVIYRELSGDHVRLLDSYRFAVKNSFKPVISNGYLMYYDADRLALKLSSKLYPKDAKSPEVINDAKDQRIAEYNKNAQNPFLKIRPGSYDPGLSVFYSKEGSIMGFCPARKNGERAIVDDIYISPSISDPEIYERLLTGSLTLVVMDAVARDICIQAVNEEKLGTIRKILGKERELYPMIELIRRLD